eukprot:TRINITY_DN7520_c0_g1_i1.p1 TRINITY_DN7520_c0_g1~~TRINITY_DN7520_c0_g1_i1.p1  ORF type:complete len:364 (-),score=75.60 TRINITY_DN7520_c0_g1_i1:128-1135(-)
MVQARTFLALVSGSLFLMNLSSAVGYFLISFNLFDEYQTKENRVETDSSLAPLPNFWLTFADLCLNLILHIFFALFATVLWTLRVADARGDLLDILPRAGVTLTVMHFVVFSFFGTFNSFVLDRFVFFSFLLPSFLLTIHVLWEVKKLDIFDSREKMVEQAKNFHLLSLVLMFTDFCLKLIIKHQLLHSNLDVKKAHAQNDLSIFVSFFIILSNITGFSCWLLPDLPKQVNEKLKIIKSAIQRQPSPQSPSTPTPTPTSHTNVDDNILPKETLLFLHHLHLTAAFLSLLANQSCSLLHLITAVMVGVVIKSIDPAADQLFFPLAAGQKRSFEMTY